MMFESVLQAIVDECGGGFSAALMGLDGIAVAQVTARGGRDRDDPLGGDATFAGIEFGRILGDMSRIGDDHREKISDAAGRFADSDEHGQIRHVEPCTASSRNISRREHPHDPVFDNQFEPNLSPTLDYPFGTDTNGRDILSRVLAGSRNVLLIAPAADSP